MPSVNPIIRDIARGLVLLLLVLLTISTLAALTACGGGDPNNAPDKRVPGLDCKARPEVCQ